MGFFTSLFGNKTKNIVKDLENRYGKVVISGGGLLYVSFDLKKIAILDTKDNVTEYGFDQLIDCKLSINDNVISAKEGGLGRALAGGVLFGGVGAVVGAVTKSTTTKNIISKVELSIIVNDTQNPVITFSGISGMREYDAMIDKYVIQPYTRAYGLLQLALRGESNA